MLFAPKYANDNSTTKIYLINSNEKLQANQKTSITEKQNVPKTLLKHAVEELLAHKDKK